MSKARILANLISDNAELADGQISVAEVVGAAPLASPTFTGTVTSTGDINLGDNDKAIFGSGSDLLQIYRNSSGSYVKESGSGSLYIQGTDVRIQNASGENILNGTSNGAVTLYYNDSPKIASSSTGATISGDVGATTASIAGKTTTNELDLNAIASTITDTAVDVFVYDTSKDSDGGAWRKRTQHTSWYNEAASATRGSRKEFPAVAVIVAESTQVTIYDGDDPDMPMWMVFETNASDMIASGILSLTMLNGVLAVGRNTPLHVINFVSDGHTSYSPTSRNSYLGAIGQRNSGLGFSANLGTPYVVANVGNDVAMTVLPNAPIDAATGLPVPTIAIASNGGVSVIKDDGTVVDITGGSQGADMPIDQISFVGNHSVLFSHRYASEVSTIPSSDSNAAYYNQVPTFTGRITNSISHDDDTHLAALSSDNNIESIAIDEDNAVSKSVSGVSRHNHFAIAGDTDRASAFITSSYNTGWMNGDIKLATLSDTDDTDVTGSELVTNGTFDSDVSGWTGTSGGSIAYSSGRAQVTSSSYYGAVQAITVEVGKTYVLSFNAQAGTSNPRIRVGDASNPVKYVNQGIGAGPNDHYYTIIATDNTTIRIFLSTSNASGTSFFDNVSVRLAEEDRSVNGNGLRVNGTITKNPVASGADLVAYSGFSTSNYLKQPHNSGLNFGTGDFCVMGWVKSNSHEAGTLFDRGPANGADEYRIFVNINVDGSILFRTTAAASARSSIQTAANAYPENAWSKFCFVRRNAGTTQEIYVNGKLAATASVAARDIDSVTSTLIVGVARSVSNPCNDSSIALFRISATAPSPEQIAKIYNDEKHLFQDGAQATLYGSSDAVMALAYDDTTDLLHAGTSAGRSVFQGLRRVDNTTDAITAAISASNGLVAEE